MGSPPAPTLLQGMKTPGKPDEAWIMNRLTKQLTDMGFPVTGVSPALLSPLVYCPHLSGVTRKAGFKGMRRLSWPSS